MLGIPVPAVLIRTTAPYRQHELAGDQILGHLCEENKTFLTEQLSGLGANVTDIFNKTGTYNTLLFDASNFKKTVDLDLLYQFFRKSIKNLLPNGRVVVIAPAPTRFQQAEKAATIKAVEGFVRALAKEIGRKGSTANLVSLTENGPQDLTSVFAFLMSERSAFISGQVMVVRNSETDFKISIEQSLKGKTAIVTGAARGIGAAIARKLAKEGATVVIVDRPEEQEAANKLATEINGKVLLQDISKPEAADNIAEFCKTNPKGLDILVHNAGVTRDKTIANMEYAHWQQVMDINLRSIITINKTLLNGVLNDDGRIVCMSSVSGIAGNFGQTNYAATKAGLIGYVEALGQRYADKGITVNAIAPGFIETQMTAKIPFMTKQVGRKLSNLAQGGLPEDVADLAVFLALPGAGGVNGQTLRVCGGALIGK